MTTTAKKKAGELKAELRTGNGTGDARALRRAGKIPGILYGKGQTPVSIALPLKEVTMEYQKGRFRSRLVNIALDGKTVEALPKDLQFNPVTDQIEHVDFIKVEKGVELKVSVPVKLHGQEKSVGLKRGGVINVVRHEIDFLCLPEAIPGAIEIDVKNLSIGDSVHIEDIKLPEGVKPFIQRNFTVVTIAGRAKEEESTPVAASAAPAVEAEGAKEEPKKEEK